VSLWMRDILLLYWRTYSYCLMPCVSPTPRWIHLILKAGSPLHIAALLTQLFLTWRIWTFSKIVCEQTAKLIAAFVCIGIVFVSLSSPTYDLKEYVSLTHRLDECQHLYHFSSPCRGECSTNLAVNLIPETNFQLLAWGARHGGWISLTGGH
jgi:hypothetical protein